jgi:hypothetical protein
MARFSPTDAVFAGFRFARERPGSLLVWASYLLVALTVASIAMVDIGGQSLTSLAIAVQGSDPDPQQLAKLMQEVLPATLFFSLLMLVFGAVLSTAILRVRMTPGPHPWGGLRLGGDELKLLAAKVLALASAFVVWILISAVVVALGGDPLAAALGLIVGLALLMVPLMIRLSLAGVVSQIEGRVTPVRSFQLTKPLFWRLLGAYVLLAAIMLVIMVLLAIIFAALLAVTGGTFQQVMLTLLQGRYGDLSPLAIVVFVLSRLATFWVAVVATVVFLSITVDAYDAALREQN